MYMVYLVNTVRNMYIGKVVNVHIAALNWFMYVCNSLEDLSGPDQIQIGKYSIEAELIPRLVRYTCILNSAVD